MEGGWLGGGRLLQAGSGAIPTPPCDTPPPCADSPRHERRVAAPLRDGGGGGEGGRGAGVGRWRWPRAAAAAVDIPTAQKLPLLQLLDPEGRQARGYAAGGGGGRRCGPLRGVAAAGERRAPACVFVVALLVAAAALLLLRLACAATERDSCDPSLHPGIACGSCGEACTTERRSSGCSSGSGGDSAACRTPSGRRAGRPRASHHPAMHD